jgi:hypothetical protein
MTSEKGLYWLAVGIMAIVFTNSAATRQGWLASVEGRSMQLANQISARAMATLNLAQLRVGPQQCARTQAAVMRAQAKFGCMQAAVARQQAAFARLEAQRARMEAFQNMHIDMVPQARNFRIEIPRPRLMPTDGTI